MCKVQPLENSPDMLALWGYKESAACPLCKADQCTLHHVLVNCNVALEQGRYTWRHDSVLQNIEKEVQRIFRTSTIEPRACSPKSPARTFTLASFVRVNLEADHILR